jgi:hypothetical protein
MEVAEVGIGLPLTLELDVEVRSSGLRSKSGTPATCTMASIKGRVEPIFQGKGSDKDPEVGIGNPLGGGKGKQRLRGGDGNNSKEVAEGRDGTKGGARDIRDGDLDRRAIKLASFGVAE